VLEGWKRFTGIRGLGIELRNGFLPPGSASSQCWKPTSPVRQASNGAKRCPLAAMTTELLDTAPLVEREILHPLLMEDQTSRLRQIALGESKLQQINRAVAWIKVNFHEPFSLIVIARSTASCSSFSRLSLEGLC
jgi:hypothetical protein